jgi:putative ABC transport system permease protein
MRGMQRAMEANVVELETGDVQLFAQGYQERPSLYLRIERPEGLLAALDREGYAASARLRAAGLAAAGASSGGAFLIGVDVARDHRVSRIDREVERGSWLDPGGEILLLTNAADGSMANELYRVRGVLRGVGDAIDRGGVYMNAAAWRELLVVPEGVHQIIVRRPAGVDLPAARARVAALAPALDVKSWVQLLPTLANILETQEGSLVLIELIVYAAVASVILNAMMMAVFERIRELGLLKAVGMKPRTVFALVACEGLWQTAVAVAAGLLLAAPLLYYLVHHGLNIASLAGASIQGIAYNAEWHAEVDRATVAGPIAMLVLAVAAAITFPALKAARLKPLDAMRYR